MLSSHASDSVNNLLPRDLGWASGDRLRRQATTLDADTSRKSASYMFTGFHVGGRCASCKPFVNNRGSLRAPLPAPAPAAAMWADKHVAIWSLKHATSDALTPALGIACALALRAFFVRESGSQGNSLRDMPWSGKGEGNVKRAHNRARGSHVQPGIRTDDAQTDVGLEELGPKASLRSYHFVWVLHRRQKRCRSIRVPSPGMPDDLRSNGLGRFGK